MALRFAPELAAARASRWRLALLLVLITSAALPFVTGQASQGEPPLRAQHEWPLEFDGQPLRPLALSAVEQRFAEQFPGRIGRFSSTDGAITLRIAERPTRMLHPATDCYRGLGYRIRDTRLERDAKSQLWRCFTAWRDGKAVRVCERIEAGNGEAFTDTSAWYWAAALGRSKGPWLAVTKARQINL
ncbi:MAG TPA: hypothetical protein VN645_01045 [Steroidobacteraceae bacterium]|nr:hypothetical protein [Steroidobacteraceae bacterium]